jgi:hypothetical protein
MGCGASKHTIREVDIPVPKGEPEKPRRTTVENYQVEGGALYAGDMFDGLRDGTGTQKCMYSKLLIFH